MQMQRFLRGTLFVFGCIAFAFEMNEMGFCHGLVTIQLVTTEQLESRVQNFHHAAHCPLCRPPQPANLQRTRIHATGRIPSSQAHYTALYLLITMKRRALHNKMTNKRLFFFTALLLSSAQHISIISAAQDHPDDSSATTIEQLRIFQTLPNDPSEMTPMELSEMHRRLRATRAMVFGGGGGANNYTHTHDTTNFRLTLEIYTPAERRDYLVKKGKYCYPSDTKIGPSLRWKDVVTRYDSLMNEDAMTKSNVNENSYNNNDNKYPSNNKGRLYRLATELWKYCLLYNGDGHVYLGYDEAQLLHPLQAVLGDAHSNYGVESILQGKGNDNNHHYLHDSFMAVSPYNPAKVELSTMIRMLLETSNDVLALHPMLPSKMFHQVVSDGSAGSSEGDGTDMSSSWKLLQSHCINVAKDTQGDGELSPIESTLGSNGNSNLYSNFEQSSSSRSLALQLGGAQSMSGQVATNCPLSSGGYCCLAFLSNDVADNPVIALRHSIMSGDSGLSSNGSLLPYKLEGEARSKVGSTATASKQTPDLGVVPAADLPYISTVRLLHNHTSSMPPSSATRFPSHPADSSNFFDIMFENDCLPYTKQCLRCLKDVSNEAHLKKQGEEEEGLSSFSETQTKRKLGGPQMDNACSKCHLECPCYCDVLCKIRPLPKEVVRTYAINPPKYKKAVDRLVPKIIHQTWFEPLTKEKYPNFSRLAESWKKSGWEYYFYDDEAAREFLSTHFPPEVGEAYDSIIPGKFAFRVSRKIYGSVSLTQLSPCFFFQGHSKLIYFVTVYC